MASNVPCFAETKADISVSRSDAMAEWTEHKDATVPDYVLGQYVENDTAYVSSNSPGLFFTLIRDF